VRRHALQTVNAIIHTHPELISPALMRSAIMPVRAAAPRRRRPQALAQHAVTRRCIVQVLFEAIRPRADLLRVVDYGPFQEEEDDG
jgi:hypothetical protein